MYRQAGSWAVRRREEKRGVEKKREVYRGWWNSEGEMGEVCANRIRK